MASWLNCFPLRESYPVGSSHHQTFLSKALYEHGVNYHTIAAVAVTSSTFQNCSLGPNLLALIPIEYQEGFDLFTLFMPSSSTSTSTENDDQEKYIPTTLQFSKKLYFHHNPFAPPNFSPSSKISKSLLSPLFNNTKYLRHSLQEIVIYTDMDDDYMAVPIIPLVDLICARRFGQEGPEKLVGVKSFHLRTELSEVNQFVGQILEACPNLTSLNLESCIHLKKQGIRQLTEKSKKSTRLNIVSLNLSSSHAPAEDLAEIATHLPNLTYLNLDYCSRVTDRVCYAIAENLKNLSSLEMTYPVSCSEKGLMAIAQSNTSLQKLGIGYCSKGLTDKVFEAIALNLVDLTELDVSHTANSFTSQAFKNIFSSSTQIPFPRLQSLDLNSCSNAVTDETLEYFCSSPFLHQNLTSLNINNCYEISDEGMIKLTKKFTNLERLILVYCTRLTDVSLKSIDENLVNLKELNIYSCKFSKECKENCVNIRKLIARQ